MRGIGSWRRRRRAAVWAAGLTLTSVVTLVTLGLAAANTVPTSQGGDGAGTVSGYTVSSIKYNLNATNPQNVDSVTFTLDSTPPAGSTMKIQVTAAGTWYSCTNAGANLTCTTTSPQLAVTTVTSLRIVVAQ